MGISSSHNSSLQMASADVQAEIEETINNNCVVIYSKRGCPYCSMATAVFKKLGRDFLEIDINQKPNTAQIQNILQQMTGARSVPRVFVSGKCIGGGSETKALHASGELQAMLQNCS